MTAGSQGNSDDRGTISPIVFKKPIEPSPETNEGGLFSHEFPQREETNQEDRQITLSVAQFTIERQVENPIKVNDIEMDITEEEEQQVLNRTI